jgi:hypothetical protein
METLEKKHFSTSASPLRNAFNVKENGKKRKSQHQRMAPGYMPDYAEESKMQIPVLS